LFGYESGSKLLTDQAKANHKTAKKTVFVILFFQNLPFSLTKTLVKKKRKIRNYIKNYKSIFNVNPGFLRYCSCLKNGQQYLRKISEFLLHLLFKGQ
jgi:hypothetical protein